MSDVIFQWRRGTAAEWLEWDFVLRAGEPGYEQDTGNFKIGDGSTPWVDLAYHLDEDGLQAFIDDYLEGVGTGVDVRIGDMEDLVTENKDTVVEAINETHSPDNVPFTILYDNAKAG